MMKFTEMELKVLKSLAFNHYGEGDATWSWAVNESRHPSGLKGKTLSGVVASLVKKGLFRVEAGETKKEDALWTTNAGRAVMVEHGWKEKANESNPD